MASPPVELPARAWFKASEVCEIAQVQPFILRSWEKDSPDLGVAKTPGAARLYRKADVQRVLQIKDLLFVEGLTLAGARRRLEPAPPVEAAPEPDLPGGDAEPIVVSDDVRRRLATVKLGLFSLLRLLEPEGIAGRAEAQSAPVTAPAKAAIVPAREFSLEPVDGEPAGEEEAAPKSTSRGSRAASPTARRRRA